MRSKKRSGVPALLLFSCLLTLTTARMIAQKNPARSTIFKTYRDPVHGVRFTYPARWQFSDGMKFYVGTAILNSADGPVKAIAAVGFYTDHGDGYRPYPHTNLSGVQFAYTVRATPNETGCEEIAKGIEEDDSVKGRQHYEMIHGVRYLHAFGGEDGLGHGVSREIYAAYRSDQCYLFEQDIHTIAPDVEPGEKLLSKDAMAKLHAQLRDVMLSVHVE